MKPKQLLVECVGWYGAGAILLAYILVSFGTILPNSMAYQFLNATGSIGIVILSLSKRAYPSAALNAVWAVVALVILAGLLR